MKKNKHARRLAQVVDYPIDQVALATELTGIQPALPPDDAQDEHDE